MRAVSVLPRNCLRVQLDKELSQRELGPTASPGTKLWGGEAHLCLSFPICGEWISVTTLWTTQYDSLKTNQQPTQLPKAKHDIFISCLGLKQNLAPWKERVDIFKQKNWNTHSYCEKNLFFLSNLTNSMITNRNRAKRHKGLGLDQAAQEKVLSCR